MGNSHKNLLLRNHWANYNQTLVEWSLGGPLPKLCPVIPTSNQDAIFSLAAILVGRRDHRTHFWKGAIQGPFHQSLVAIGPVVSEEKIFM
jgi:hypothetical protein